ncbi:MAG: aldehyde dehydrogenase family protein [Vicinamibacteria bacterium]
MTPRDGHFIGGEWVAASGRERIPVLNPATEEVLASVPAGTPEDVDRAVAAARAAFAEWSQTSPERRAAMLDAIAAGLLARKLELAETIAREMGMPLKLARMIQAALPPTHFTSYARLLGQRSFVRDAGSTRVVSEPVGVCGLITPWNFPLHQIAGKLAPALAAGCTVVLKPSELAPLNANLLAEVIAGSGLPPGVFNLVHGEGPVAGEAIAAHPGIEMVSFTGSTRAGILVARAAAGSVKRVTQELGGKSANLILDHDDLPRAVRAGVNDCFLNSGQACNAPTRMLVPAARQDEAIEIARRVAGEVRLGDPFEIGVTMGPLVSRAQLERVRAFIRAGIEEGALLVAGGPERPEGMDRGYFVRPTVFARVRNEMTIAREEIFGPVLCILPFEDEDDAIRIANDSPYGLAAQVSGPAERARAIAARLRVGQVTLNRARFDPCAPFGGYKRSGNGREFGEWGLQEFLETKAIIGFGI